MIPGLTEPYCIGDDTSEHCYQIIDTKISWKKASDICKHYGGNLVIIESAEEQKFISDLMKNIKFNVSGLWLGSDKLYPEEQRSWANGDKFSYLNWEPGEPNSHVIDENCVEIHTNDSRWNDVRCTELNGYICENSRT
ncbi:hypothetical protein ACJMK2_022477 [Sinanodonta woodiana]|uniref:C-type lectin domain-containing protein n=1 Tax=Sinanodonta woodiana TaxID=1069815 RepID=A0ABD3TJ83_SINWO